jgi:spoIIIJ-associated protein
MRSIETEGDTIDEAIANALKALHEARERVEIQILADATRGLFGFGGRKARIRATVRAPLSVTLEPEHGSSSRHTVSWEAPVREREVAAKPRVVTEERAASVVSAPAPPLPSPASEKAEGRARAVLSELLTHLGVSCTVSVGDAAEPGTTLLQIRGDSGGLVIGRRGQTLDAIEYVVNRIVARDDEGVGRFIVDAEGYRERRRAYLEELARRLADKVRQTGRGATLNPMSPRDRRIVHLAVQGDTEVASRSQGQGYYRKIVILPADQARPRGDAKVRPR